MASELVIVEKGRINEPTTLAAGNVQRILKKLQTESDLGFCNRGYLGLLVLHPRSAGRKKIFTR